MNLIENPVVRDAVKKIIIALLLAALSILGYDKMVVEPEQRALRAKLQADAAR